MHGDYRDIIDNSMFEKDYILEHVLPRLYRMMFIFMKGDL